MESNDSDPEEKETAKVADPAHKDSPKRRNYAIRKSQVAVVNKNQKNLGVSNPLDAKWIRVYINGDEHFSGFKCVVNSKYYRNFDAFLSYLTERLRPAFGAVRNIYTPISGHTIRTLEDLRPNQKYVVAGSEKLKKLEPGYADIGFKSIKKSELKPTFKRKCSSLKSRQLDQSLVTLYFYKNGAPRTKPVKMVFQTKDLLNFERIFDKLKYKMQCGPIKRLYSLNGKPVNNLSELQNDQSYVVVEKYEVFKTVSYGSHQVKDRQLIRDHQKKLLCAENSRIPVAVNASEKQSADVLDQNNGDISPVNASEKQSADVLDQNNGDISPVNATEKQSADVLDQNNGDISPVNASEKQSADVLDQNNKNISFVGSAVNPRIESKAEKEKINNRSILGSSKIDLYKFSSCGNDVQKYEPSATYELSFQVKELDLDVDLGGVYRAKEKYYLTEGAKEIQDDFETAVEISTDELDAEEVEEEEEELTPDMERSMQHLNLDPPDELVAFLPSMQGKQSAANNERNSSDKYNLSQSQTFESQNLIV